ncbi:MAG: LytTR family DNA-binding domain-containing protein [Eubacteriales bacterium]|nr:LytTR family DNA-binding domain-containing protein [Eubacteriales bacterium]
MKLSLQQIDTGEEEVIIRYKEETEFVHELANFVLNGNKKIPVFKDREQVLLSPTDILYMESIDRTTYVYTGDNVYTICMSLRAFETVIGDASFFRCSKAMIINIRHILSLKSLSGNRIDACMDNNEHIVISRRYARQLREVLRGEGE